MNRASRREGSGTPMTSGLRALRTHPGRLRRRLGEERTTPPASSPGRLPVTGYRLPDDHGRGDPLTESRTSRNASSMG